MTPRRARHQWTHATTFRAWRHSGETARELEIDPTDTLADALAAATTHYFAHKDRLFIHELDEGRGKGTLHAYAIVKKAATYLRNPATGLPERVEPLSPTLLFSLPVDAFEPTRAFDALRDDARGVDLTLVEQRA